MANRKNPYLALFLSLMIPGLGQLYNNETIKGLVVLALCVGLGFLFYVLSGLNRVTAVLILIVVWLSAVVEAYKMAKASGQPVDFYYKIPYVVGMLLLVGPLALPLLWKSPYFSRAAQWVWTIVVVGVALLFVVTPYLLSWFVERAPQLAPRAL